MHSLPGNILATTIVSAEKIIRLNDGESSGVISVEIVHIAQHFDLELIRNLHKIVNQHYSDCTMLNNKLLTLMVLARFRTSIAVILFSKDMPQ